MDTTNATTYTIYDYLIPTLEERINRANGRARRIGQPGYTLTTTPAEPEPVWDEDLISRWHRDENGESDYPLDRNGNPLEPFDYRARTIVTIHGLVPQLPGGWKLIGLVDEDPIVGPMPKLITDEARSLNLNLDPYRDLDTWNDCDHCKRNRDRGRVFLVRAEDGTIARVGSTCLAAFLGVTIQIPGDMFRVMKDAEDMEEAAWGGSTFDVSYRIDHILAIAHATVAEFGWVSSDAARYTPGMHSTGERVSLLLKEKGRAAAEERWEMINSVPADLVADMVAYARDLRDSDDSEYARTVSQVVRAGSLASGRNIRIIASVVSGYQRAQARRALDSVVINSEHIGEVGKRQTFTDLKVIFTKMIENPYGMTQLVKFVDPDGNVLIWWNSGRTNPEIGKTYTVTGTVKAYDERDGVKQTVITRCKLA